MQQRINNTLCRRWQWITRTVYTSVHMDSSNMYDTLALLSQRAATMIKSLSAFTAISSKTQWKSIFSTRRPAGWRRPECIEVEAWSGLINIPLDMLPTQIEMRRRDGQSERQTRTDTMKGRGPLLWVCLWTISAQWLHVTVTFKQHGRWQAVGIVTKERKKNWNKLSTGCQEARCLLGMGDFCFRRSACVY